LIKTSVTRTNLNSGYYDHTGLPRVITKAPLFYCLNLEHWNTKKKDDYKINKYKTEVKSNNMGVLKYG